MSTAAEPPVEFNICDDKCAEDLRVLISEIENPQVIEGHPDIRKTARHLYKLTIPAIQNLMREIAAAQEEVKANAAKARADLDAHAEAVKARPIGAEDRPSDEVIASERAKLHAEIDDAERGKISRLEAEMTAADNALVKISGRVAEAKEALAKYEAGKAAGSK